MPIVQQGCCSTLLLVLISPFSAVEENQPCSTFSWRKNPKREPLHVCTSAGANSQSHFLLGSNIVMYLLDFNRGEDGVDQFPSPCLSPVNGAFEKQTQVVRCENSRQTHSTRDQQIRTMNREAPQGRGRQSETLVSQMCVNAQAASQVQVQAQAQAQAEVQQVHEWGGGGVGMQAIHSSLGTECTLPQASASGCQW